MTDLKDLPHAANYLRAIEAQEQAQEDALRREQEALARSQEAALEDSGLARAKEIVNNLAPLYDRRRELAEKAAPFLAALWECENEIRQRELAALDILRQTRRFTNIPEPLQQLNDLRAQANLPQRAETGLPRPTTTGELLAATAIYAIFSHCVTPGQIAVAGRSVAISFNKGGPL